MRISLFFLFLSHVTIAQVTGNGQTTDYYTSYGNQAGNSSHSVYIGYTTGQFTTPFPAPGQPISGVFNTYVGHQAGTGQFGVISTGVFNTFLGSATGNRNTTGNQNFFGGAQSGLFNTSGSGNVFLGFNAGKGNLNFPITGNSNTFVGNSAGQNIINGSDNLLLGNTAGAGNLKSGNQNLMFGKFSGYQNDGSNNVFIGTYAGYLESGSNKLYIHNSATAQTPLIFGDFQTRNLKFNVNQSLSSFVEISSKQAGFSGLRFTNLTNTIASINNPTNKILSVNEFGDVILVNDLQGSGSGGSTIINAGANISVTGNTTSGYTISSPTTNVLSLSGNTITSTVNGVASIVSMPNLIDTDAQTLSISGNNLSISNGNTIVLPTMTEIDGDVTNELQTLSQSPIQTTGTEISLSNGGGTVFIDGSETKIQAGTNVVITGNGTTATPYIINSTALGNGPDTSIYENDGIINQATTTTALNLRTVDMRDTNLFFNTANSSFVNGTRGFGRIYIGNTTNFPLLISNPIAQNSYRLLVEGGVLTEKVKVALRSTANWADYVFGENYNLMPLSDVEKFIIKNKHLPNVPSAEELKNEGLDLGEMQAKQMEKIEELTLYVIEQNKKLERQEKEIEELKSLVNSLIEKK